MWKHWNVTFDTQIFSIFQKYFITRANILVHYKCTYILARWQNDLPVLYSVDALFVLTVQALIFPSASPTMRGPWRGQHIHVTDEGWMNLLQITFLVSPQSSPTCNNAIALRQNWKVWHIITSFLRHKWPHAKNAHNTFFWGSSHFCVYVRQCLMRLRQTLYAVRTVHGNGKGESKHRKTIIRRCAGVLSPLHKQQHISAFFNDMLL